MDALELTIDRALFSPEVLARTAHRYSADFYVKLDTTAEHVRVRLQAKRAGVDTCNLAERFHTDALDDRLRAIVAAQTHDLQVVLTRAALTQAEPPAQGGA